MVPDSTKLSIEIVPSQAVNWEVDREVVVRMSTKKIVNYNPREFLLAKVHDTFIGFLHFTTSKNSSVVILEHIEITNEMRRKGVGSALLQKLIEKAKELGKKTLRIEFITPNLEILQLSEEDIEENALEETLAQERQINGYNLFFAQFMAKSGLSFEENQREVCRRVWRDLGFKISE